VATNLAGLYGETVYYTNKAYNLHQGSVKMKEELLERQQKSRSQLEVAHRMVGIKRSLAGSIQRLITEAETKIASEDEESRAHRQALRKKQEYEQIYGS